MSDNTIYNVIGGTTIQAADVNQYKTAAVGDITPRTSTGAPTDQAGSLGTTLLKWLNVWAVSLFGLTQVVFGSDASVGAKITVDGSDNLQIEKDDNVVAVFDDNGLSGQYLEAATVPETSLVGSYSDSFLADNSITTRVLDNPTYFASWATTSVAASPASVTVATVTATFKANRPVTIAAQRNSGTVGTNYPIFYRNGVQMEQSANLLSSTSYQSYILSGGVVLAHDYPRVAGTVTYTVVFYGSYNSTSTGAAGEISIVQL